MMKSFIGSFYATIFLAIFALGQIPAADLHEIWTAVDAKAVASLCNLFIGVWFIFTGVAAMCGGLFDSAMDGFFSVAWRIFSRWKSSRAIKSLTIFCILALALTGLSACTDSTELQHDGSGSDEMLKSPCACLPVPYDPPSFQWSRV